MAEGEDLLWECEAFGIPDVDYAWLRNSRPLDNKTLTVEEKERYSITSSVLRIKVKIRDYYYQLDIIRLRLAAGQ